MMRSKEEIREWGSKRNRKEEKCREKRGEGKDMSKYEWTTLCQSFRQMYETTHTSLTLVTK